MGKKTKGWPKLEDLTLEQRAHAEAQIRSNVDAGHEPHAAITYGLVPMPPELALEVVARELEDPPEVMAGAKPPPQKRPPSKGELAYEEHLRTMQAAGVVRAWTAQPFRVLLGPNCTYTPDFLVSFTRAARPALVEVKGASKSKSAIGGAWWPEGSRDKARLAADRLGAHFVFGVAVYQGKGKGFVYTERFA